MITTLKTKSLLTILLISSILLLALFFYFKQQEIKVVPMSGDIVSNYDNVIELNEQAELIMEVTINSIENINFSEVLFTLSEAEVVNVYKGESVHRINILETGGTGEILIDGQKEEVQVIFEENEPFSEGENAIVYLERYEGPIAEDAYIILGVYQGKFIKTDLANEIIPPSNAGDLEEYTVIEDLELSSLDSQ